ncbi:MAG: tetratricopeptide repeat protein [Oligoflexales bacterium]
MIISVPIQDAIVFVESTGIRDSVRQCVRDSNIKTLHVAANIDECSDLLQKHETALLIIDWQPPATVSLLEFSKKMSGDFLPRPTFLISVTVSQELVALAVDQQVTRFHQGSLTKQDLNDHIQFLQNYAEDSHQQDYRLKFEDAIKKKKLAMYQDSLNILLEIEEEYGLKSETLAEKTNCHILLENWEDARNTAKKLMSSFPENPRGRHLLGRCFLKQGLYEEASNILQEAQILNPWHSDRIVELGQALLKSGKTAAAQKNFDKALELQSDKTEAIIGKSQCHMLQDSINDALTLLKNIREPREIASIFNDSAVLCIRQLKYDQALSLYRTALSFLSDKPRFQARIFFNMGLGYYKSGQKDDALEAFESALQKDPSFTSASHNSQILSKASTQKSGTNRSQDIITKFEDFDDEGF